VRYSGYTAWRGVSPVRIERGHLIESWGTGERFGLVDIGSGTYWFATANVPAGRVDDPSRHKELLMQRFARWHGPIGTVLEATPEDRMLHDDVFFLDPLDRWSKGHTALLGDAAHATTPGVGQGAAQALEDAIALADELASAKGLPAALQRYEARRRSRAALALRLSRRADAAAQLGSPLGCRLRDALVSRVPQRFQARQLAPLIRGGP
jgi:2-polyprenyl-6-methoxyphenol hydroxylase-like FAD-dependent oxidoreductase